MPEEAGNFTIPTLPEGVEEQPWHGFYFDAFDALRFDRSYGAMGGESPISYQAVSRYAEDHGIVGEEFVLFRIFIRVIDICHLEVAARKAEAERKKA